MNSSYKPVSQIHTILYSIYIVWIRDTPGDVNAALATACTFILELIKGILGNVVNH